MSEDSNSNLQEEPDDIFFNPKRVEMIGDLWWKRERDRACLTWLTGWLVAMHSGEAISQFHWQKSVIGSCRFNTATQLLIYTVSSRPVLRFLDTNKKLVLLSDFPPLDTVLSYSYSSIFLTALSQSCQQFMRVIDPSSTVLNSQ